jgi:hypothetical protein
MRKFVYEVYEDGFSVGKESTDFLMEQIKKGKSQISSKLFGRVSEFGGVMEGWVPENDDPRFNLNRYLSDNIIIKTDTFSKFVAGKEPFYEYSFPPHGPGTILPWIFKFLLSYTAGKGLDYLIEKLKSKEAYELAKEISKYWGDENGDSLGEIRTEFDNGNKITMERYPENINRITTKQLDKIKTGLAQTKKTSVIYDAWGRITVYQEDAFGNSIDVDV